MSIISKRFCKIKEYLKALSANDYILLILVATAFISVIPETIFILLLPIYAILTKQGKMLLPKKKYQFLLLAFSLCAAGTTLYFARDVQLPDFFVKKEMFYLLSVAIILVVFDIYFLMNIVSRESFFRTLKFACLMSFSSFFIALYQKAFGLFADPERPNRFASVYINENYYGMVIEFLVLIALYFLISSKTIRKKIFYFAVIIANIGGLWFCQCRSAYIALAIAVLLFFSIRDRRYFWILSFVIVLAVIAVVKNPTLLPRFDTSFDYLSYRFGIWKGALECFADFPVFGHGYYAYPSICSVYSEGMFTDVHSHNLFIECLLNFGIVGAFPLAGFFVISTKNSVCAFVHTKGNHEKNEIALILSLVAAILIHGLADITIFWPQTAIFAVLIICCPQNFAESYRKDASQ